MSLNRTLARLFDEVRREARRNPDFARKLDAIIRVHQSGLEPDEAFLAALEEEAPVAAASVWSAPPPVELAAPVAFNPLVVFKREGADGLRAALMDDAWSDIALQGLLRDHNLDPAGDAAVLPKPAMVEHIVAQAGRRAERDKKLFDY
jgi:hypothetical protein